MRAVVVHDYEQGAVIEEVAVDDPRPGEVLIRVAASGICGSDLHVLHGRSVVARLPMVLGHEGAGVVEAVGAGVSSVAPGDHVVLGLYGPCGTCRACLVGEIVHCDGAERLANIMGSMADGSTRLHQGDVDLHPMVGTGSLAEYAVVRAAQAVKVSPEAPLDVVALAGCGVTTGLGAVFNIARPGPGQSVAVVGCGGVGLNVVQGCRLAGAHPIIAVDTNPSKLDLAADFGATHLVDASARPMAEGVAEVVPGGVDHAFEVVGSAQLLAETFLLTRPGGQCVMVGSPPADEPLPIDGRALFAERILRGCTGGSNIPQRDIPRIVDLYLAGRLELEALVSQRLPLDRVGEGFAACEAGTVARSVVVFG